MKKVKETITHCSWIRLFDSENDSKVLSQEKAVSKIPR